MDKEAEDMNVPMIEQSKELFSYFGLAVYYSQALEQQLVNLIMLMKLSQGQQFSEADLSALYQRKLSNSLGQLVVEIKHKFSFSEEEAVQLTLLWKQRNYIVHDYFKKRIHDTFTADGRKEIIAELQLFSDQARKLESRLQHYARDLANQINYYE